MTAFWGLVASNAVGELYRIYATTERDRIAFNLALIEDDFTESYRARFDPDYMNKLFAYGHARGITGYPWQKTPPGFTTAAR